MFLFDWLTGNKKPDPSVPRRSAEDLKQALLAAAPADAPWQVRTDGDGKADLIGEWRIEDAKWYGFFSKASVTRTFRVLMRLDDATSMARSVDEEVSVSWEAGIPRLAFSATAFRGQKIEVSGGAEWGKTADGSFGKLGSYRLSTNDMKIPLRKIVADSGWGWHGVAFAKL